MSDTIAIQSKMQQEFVSITGLRAYLERLSDPRKAKGRRYQLADVLSLLVLAKLGGEDQMKGMAEWIRHAAQAVRDSPKAFTTSNHL